MNLPLPKYLATLVSSPQPVKHTWDAGDDMAALGNETPAMLKNLGALSFRAVLGLEAALGEWMVARFAHLSKDPTTDLVNDAVWAASIDYRYLKRDALDFPDASGPIEGPLRDFNAGSRDICEAYPDAEFGAVRYLIGSANLVKYVLPNSKGFQAWFKMVVQHLPSLSKPAAREAGALDIKIIKQPPTGVSEAIFGTAAPREAYDPSFDVAAADSAGLINAMLARITSRPNPYLYSPADLKAAGFPGTPYRYPA
jgi:hypothetical protein